MNENNSKVIIGCEEWCAFPELGIPAINARVDSGAKTSSLHAFNIKKFKRNGETWVNFEVHPLQHDRKTTIRCEKPIVDKRLVKSSSGEANTRYVINTTIKLGDTEWEIELTLANRDSMGYRMLLGREAMKGHILIDPSISFSTHKYSRKEINELYGITPVKKNRLK